MVTGQFADKPPTQWSVKLWIGQLVD